MRSFIIFLFACKRRQKMISYEKGKIMMQLSIVNGAVEFDGIPVLTQVNFTVREKEKIALVGRNGCGKTTLLNVLDGGIECVKGYGDESYGVYKIGNPAVGFLRQTSNDLSSKTMLDEILGAYEELLLTERNMEEALARLDEDGSEQNVRVYSALQEKYERLGGYTYKKEYLTAVKKFGFTDGDLQKPLVEFSGGQRTKIALLKLLLSKPDILLLDEPTNHLDLQAIEWLEQYLIGYRNACVIVSHDRLFLDKIVNVVYEIEYGETVRYSGNYTSFMAQKQQNYDKALKDSLLRKKEIDRLTALVERFRYKASKAAMAQSKLKQIKRIGEVGSPMRFDTDTFRTNFQPLRNTVEKTLILEDLSFGYDKELGRVNMTVKRGQKVGIIGRNGTGKSTLVKTIMHMLSPLDGNVVYGLHAQIGYFDQTLTQSFSTLTVLEDFHNEFPMLTDTEARSLLGAFMFCGDDVFKQICELSGGEKVRLALCKIFKRRPNVLILDEPTNHMDIIGKETLESMLAAYSGTVIAVSHDRYFINRICDRLIVFDDGGARVFDGTYAEYEQQNAAEETAVAEEAKAAVRKKDRRASDGNERNRRLHRISVLEEKMKALTDKIEDIKRVMSEDPSVYTDYKKIAENEEEITSLNSSLSPLEAEWLELMEADNAFKD